MTKATTSPTTPPASRRRANATTRRSAPPKAPPSTRAAAAPAASKVASRPPADPTWATALRLALDALREAEQRHKHAVDRVAVTTLAVTGAKATLSREEAAGALEYSGRSVDGEAAARHVLEDAEREAVRAQRIAIALAEAVEGHRAALQPLCEPARTGLLSLVENEMEALNSEFVAAIEFAVSIAAKAVAMADASGAAYLAEPLMRARWPSSLLRGEVFAQVGLMAGMVEPEETAASERAAALHALIVAARAAVAPETDRRVAVERAAQAATAEHERAVNDAAMQAEMAATAAAQRAKIGIGPARDLAGAQVA